jgi:hypothetical protein
MVQDGSQIQLADHRIPAALTWSREWVPEVSEENTDLASTVVQFLVRF